MTVRMRFFFPRRSARLLLLLCFAPLMTACGSGSSASPTPTSPSVSNADSNLSVEVASTDLAVGKTRFTFGLIRNNRPLSQGHPIVTYYLLHGSSGIPVMHGGANFNYFDRGLPNTPANSAAFQIQGVYVAYPQFAQAGTWAIVVRLKYGGHSLMGQSGPFTVARQSTSPAVGSPAPRSNNPTIAQEPATKLDSGRPPDDMHRLSIANAIGMRKPLLVLFATAAFCESRLCGPEIQVIQQIENRFRGRVNFVHIEIYKDANPSHGYAPAVKQWRLHTEPWTFIVDRRGIIRAKFEGPTPGSEIIPALNSVLRA